MFICQNKVYAVRRKIRPLVAYCLYSLIDSVSVVTEGGDGNV